MDTLSAMVKDGKTATPEYAEIKRRFGWEFNGMRLHELYFENLGGKSPLVVDGKLGKMLASNFSSYETWLQDFKATAAMRGIGWAILYHDIVSGKLFNQWINEHDVGHPVSCQALLILDVFEHAFITDYGLKRADYIDAFIKNINWSAVESRL
jgi:Fe-Mn family superoxide dismutase